MPVIYAKMSRLDVEKCVESERWLRARQHEVGRASWVVTESIAKVSYIDGRLIQCSIQKFRVIYLFSTSQHFRSGLTGKRQRVPGELWGKACSMRYERSSICRSSRFRQPDISIFDGCIFYINTFDAILQHYCSSKAQNASGM